MKEKKEMKNVIIKGSNEKEELIEEEEIVKEMEMIKNNLS